MISVSEALLVDQAKADDRTSLLRGLPGSAEDALRAVISGSTADDGDDSDSEVDGEGLPSASITELADWVQRANTAFGGGGRG